MHPRILAQREAEALDRMVGAATELAARFGLGNQASALRVEDRRPEIQQLFRAEALAAFLEELAAHATHAGAILTKQDVLARIEALDGIGPKTMELIRNGLAESTGEVLDQGGDGLRPATDDKLLAPVIGPTQP
jgi:dsDNA-binding SOS-regulon protein